MVRVDTDEILEAARKISSVASEVSLTASTVSRIKGSLIGTFEGDAAKVLQSQLGDLNADLRQLRNGLKSISDELKAYADRIKAADEAASHEI